MENSNNETPIKKSKKGLVAIVAIVIIAILVGVGYYYFRPLTPKEIFVTKINSVIDENLEKYDANVEKVNYAVKLSGNIEANNEQVKQIAEYINQGELKLNVQVDTKSKKASVSADVNYQNESFISGKVYYVNGDDNIYISIPDLFNKYFKFNMQNTLNNEVEILENSKISLGEKVDIKKANPILKNIISENLKEEYFSKEVVDGMDKNTIKLTGTELKQVLINIMKGLKDNQDYLKCFEKPEEIKASIEEAINSINNSEENIDGDTIEISVYTKGILKELKKVEAKFTTSEKEQGVFAINNIEDNSFDFNIQVGEETLGGKIIKEEVDNNTEKYTIIVNNVPEVGNVTLNVEIQNTQDTELDSVDVSDSVDINHLSQTDALTIYSNLMKMKIYPLIASFIN